MAIHNEQSNNIQNEQFSSSEILQNMAQPTLNKSDKKNIPMPLLIGIIAVIVIVVVAVIVSGNKKPSAPATKSQTNISTTANTTTQSTIKETTTESTTQTTTTEATTKNDYSKLLSDTIWTYYFDETDQYSIIEFIDEDSLHYYEQDGYTAIINEDLWASYEINGNELTIHTSGTNETQVYKIKVTIADKNNPSGTDCIKIQGNGTINPVEYYYG